MALIVQKYGGTSVADAEAIGRVAEHIVQRHKSGDRLVVVVSAMGKSTDELLSLASQVCRKPPRRELDMLVTAGERISMALLSMAIAQRGVDAISFTGSQSGIITEPTHQGAKIVEIRPVRIREALSQSKVVIVAGYQGVSTAREVTTLGRGGSDTTAVAMAVALGAQACEIYSDVAGVYSADPRVYSAARHFSALPYKIMQVMAHVGVQVLNAEAVEWAMRNQSEVLVGKSGGSLQEMTCIGPQTAHTQEKLAYALAVVGHTQMLWVEGEEHEILDIWSRWSALGPRPMFCEPYGDKDKGSVWRGLYCLGDSNDVDGLMRDVEESSLVSRAGGMVAVVGHRLMEQRAWLKRLALAVGDAQEVPRDLFQNAHVLAAACPEVRVEDSVCELASLLDPPPW
jgi:uridylate kinase